MPKLTGFLLTLSTIGRSMSSEQPRRPSSRRFPAVLAKSNTATNANNPKEKGLIMTVNDAVVRTPRYVLLDENRRLGARVIPSDVGGGCSVIYGFSDKRLYDRFCGNSELALRPYRSLKDT